MPILPTDIRIIIESSLAAITIVAVLGILLFSKPLHISKQPEDKVLRHLFIAVLLFAVSDLIREFQLKLDFVADDSLPGIIIFFLPDLIELYYVLLWLVFVDYTVYHRPGGIRRRVGFAGISFGILIAAQIVFYILMKRVFNEYYTMGQYTQSSMEVYAVWSWVYYVLDLIILASYMIFAWHIIRKHNKESRLPVFLRLDVFIIPFIFGVVVNLLPGVAIFTNVPCAMLSVLLTYFAVRRKYRYQDLETGYYNEKVLKYLGGYSDKRDIKGGCIIEMSVPGHEMEFMNAFPKFKPEQSLAVRMNNGSLLLFSLINSEQTFICFNDMLSDSLKAVNPDFQLFTRHWFRGKEETAVDYLDRVLGELGLAMDSQQTK
ncbi:MAG: hypothetical protein K6G03_09340 [Lachnospiraceae bacterium]|nr:hypothetical protein [Lachnospiraceae bacterium]